ncbi:MAG: biotin synthase [Leptothrix sp. (in: b-proteobacteria)]
MAEPPASDAQADRAIDPIALNRLLRPPAEMASATPATPWLHGEIARRMADRLALIRRQPAVVIDWAAAQGASTAVLAQHCPAARIVRTDADGHPLPATGAFAAPAAALGRWWRQWTGSADDTNPAAMPAPAPPEPRLRADLLWANMNLHLAADQPARIAAWHAATAVDGFLMFSCLGPDTARELHALHRELGLGPAGARCVDLHDIGDGLVQAGFADPVMDMERLTLTWADADAMLAELRTLGRNLAPHRHTGLRTPRWHARWVAQLNERLRQPDGRLHLTFEVIYGHAFRVASRAKVSSQTEISLEAMREMTRSRRAN